MRQLNINERENVLAVNVLVNKNIKTKNIYKNWLYFHCRSSAASDHRAVQASFRIHCSDCWISHDQTFLKLFFLISFYIVNVGIFPVIDVSSCLYVIIVMLKCYVYNKILNVHVLYPLYLIATWMKNICVFKSTSTDMSSNLIILYTKIVY